MSEIEKTNGDKIGPLIGSVIIILIITLGAFYLFSILKEKVETKNQNTNEAPEESVVDISVE